MVSEALPTAKTSAAPSRSRHVRAPKTSSTHSQGNKSKSLAKGRPPLARRTPATLSKKATQKLIRSHHDLNKRLMKAEAAGDDTEVKKIKRLINEAGGLQSYQLASLQGQSIQRGGDSSAVLMEWLADVNPSAADRLKLLEIGSLSTQNACTKSGVFDIERIDLHSQSPGIKQQDFMERPLPEKDAERFDILSLSLVLNFVPTTKARGDMLKRTRVFLKPPRSESTTKTQMPSGYFPSLFLVLPAACITNSHFMNDERLILMMDSLGFVLLRRKETAKLVYLLWLLRDEATPRRFTREEIRKGGKRNNFSIVLIP